MAEGLRVGILGNGGRELTTAAITAASDQVAEVIGLGKNPGYDQLEKGRSIDVGAKDIPAIVAAVDELGLDALFVGPEAPLIAGVVDAVEESNPDIAVLGPRKGLAIEGSKVRQRRMWKELGLNEGAWRVFEGEKDIDKALAYIEEQGPEHYAIKPNGETGGKGVVLAANMDEAHRAIVGNLRGELHSGAGSVLIIEERAEGERLVEMSKQGISDGNGTTLWLPNSQDHKRLLDGDVEGEENPNTGGMGAYCPVPESLISEEWDYDSEIQEAIERSQQWLADKEGTPYKGTWYETDIVDAALRRIFRIEVNVRGGDPETQAVFWKLHHAGVNLFEMLYSAARGQQTLTQQQVDAHGKEYAAVTLTGAAEGYATPGQVTGDEIFGLDNELGEDVHVDLAGVREEDGKYYTSSGRVLYITGVGRSIQEARDKAYAVVDEGKISWRGMHVRRTIGDQALNIA